MGSSSSKFKRYLQNGDEFAAMQVYQNSATLRENLDPNCSYGETHNLNTPLHYAAKHGMKHLLRAFLFEHGGDPNKQNGDDESAMHCVCRLSHIKSLSAEERRTMCISIILIWSRNGERPKLNLRNKDGNTSLHLAAQSGLLKCVELMVSNGADVFVINNENKTACELAVEAGYFDLASYLERFMVFVDSPPCDAATDLNALAEETESDLYAGLKAQDLLEAKDQLLVETADMLQVPLFTAEALLRDNEWSKALLLEKWMANAIQCCETAGIAAPISLSRSPIPPPIPRESTSPLPQANIGAHSTPKTPVNSHAQAEMDGDEADACGICFGDMASKEVGPGHGGRGCGHRFCAACWSLYLSHKIEEGSADRIVCPALNCSLLVDAEFIEKMVTPEVARKYLQFDLQAFVERNKTIKWCPWPGCGRAVKYPEVEDDLQKTLNFNQGLESPPRISHAVDCGKGHFFCWECLGEPHSPCGCDQWRKFQEKLSELKPEELKLSSMETEEAANALWLVTNSKPCPNCKSPIQKTEGCNHMKCSKCKHVFCWVCLENWKKHSSATGGYFGCNRYTAQEKAHSDLSDMISQARAKSEELQEMSKFLHYYSQYKRHQNFLNDEEPRLKNVKTKIAHMTKNLPSLDDGSKEKLTVFIEESLKELVKSRRVIRGAIVYGYFLPENAYNKAIFDLILKELEGAAETLSKIISREFLVTPREKIITTTSNLKKTRRNFLRAIARGIIPSEFPTGFSGGLSGVRRRVPTLIGLLPSEEFKAFDRMDVRALGHASLLGMVGCPPTRVPPLGATTAIGGGCHIPSSLLNLRDFESEEEENSLNQALALTLLGKCNRKLCPRPKARNPHTGAVFGYCSLRCAQFFYQFADYPTADAPSSAPLRGGDYSMDLLIALEMSRLQMIEDEARRRKSWLRERSRDHRFTAGAYSGGGDEEGKIPFHSLPREVSGMDDFCPAFATDVLTKPLSDMRTHRHTKEERSAEGPVPSCSKTSEPKKGTATNPLERTSQQMSVQNFLKKVSNNDITSRNLNTTDTGTKMKIDKNLLSFAKKPPGQEDGRFKYGDLHEHGHVLSYFGMTAEARRSLKRSMSAGDLTDRSSSDLEWITDSDHSHHQEFPEAAHKLRISELLNDQKDSQETDTLSIEDDVTVRIEDKEVKKEVRNSSEIVKIKPQRFNKAFTAKSVKSTTRNKISTFKVDGSSCPKVEKPKFQLSLKRDKKFTPETKEGSSGSKNPNLRIRVSSPNHLENQSSNECESETGIPKSPTLYISGVSINRSPEPVSPKSEVRPRSSVLNLPIFNSESSGQSSKSRTRSSSMTNPKSGQNSLQEENHLSVNTSRCIHLSSLSLQTPPLTDMSDLRVSKSASEPEKGRLIFHFPKSPTEGTLSSILHVKEDTLSSEDFHEALFLTKSPKQSKKKKEKN